MEMMNFGIPPKQTGRRRKEVGHTAWLRRLEIGIAQTYDIKYRKTLFGCAAQIGIKIATRQLGSQDVITVWRVK